MALQTSGAISLADIQGEFGGSNPISISEYYRLGGSVPDAPANSSIPTSGTISLGDFYGGTNISYSLTRSSSSINEGNTQTITLTTVGVSNGTNVPYTITGVSSSDLTSGSLTGNFTISGGTANQTFTFTEDYTSEGNETATLSLDNGEDSISWLIYDTSIPTFTLSNNASSVGSGGTITFTLNTQGVPDGTTISYTVSDNGGGDWFQSGGGSGTITINGGSGTATVNMQTFEGILNYMEDNTAYSVKANETLSNVASSTFYSRSFTSGATYTAGWWKEDGSKFYLFNTTGSTKGVYEEWTTSEGPFNYFNATRTDTKNYSDTYSNPNLQAIQFSPLGNYWFELDRGIDKVLRRAVSTAFDVDSISNTEYISSDLTTGSSTFAMFVHPSGTKFWVGGFHNPGSGSDWHILEFSMSTAWNPGTASLTSTYNHTNDTSTVSTLFGIWFNSSGNKMYLIDQNGDAAYYTLSTSWDISTLSYQRSVALPTQGTSSHHSVRWVNEIENTIEISLGSTDSNGNSTGSPSMGVSFAASV